MKSAYALKHNDMSLISDFIYENPWNVIEFDYVLKLYDFVLFSVLIFDECLFP